MRITIDIEPSPKSPVPDMVIGALPFLVPLLMRWLNPHRPDPDWERVMDDLAKAAPPKAPDAPTPPAPSV